MNTVYQSYNPANPGYIASAMPRYGPVSPYFVPPPNSRSVAVCGWRTGSTERPSNQAQTLPPVCAGAAAAASEHAVPAGGPMLLVRTPLGSMQRRRGTLATPVTGRLRLSAAAFNRNVGLGLRCRHAGVGQQNRAAEAEGINTSGRPGYWNVLSPFALGPCSACGIGPPNRSSSERFISPAL